MPLSRPVASLIVLLGCLFPETALAHEQGAPFSGAIIDPFVLHHAHIENEQRVNVFSLHGVEETESGQRKRSAFESEVEAAWSNKHFNFGGEVFVPIEVVPSPDGNGHEVGIGDIEIRPIKAALINKPDFILTTATSISVPTGSQSKGLGEGNTTLKQFLFVDKAYGNWFLGLNSGYEVNVAGAREHGMKYGAVLSYSFIKDTPKDGGLAPPMPKQKMVVAPSVEVFGNIPLQRGAPGTSATVLPGLHFWWPKSGWQFRAGVMMPLSAERDVNIAFVINIGNHLNWKRLLPSADKSPLQ